MKRLKIILQSKLFLVLSLIIICLYVLIFTRFIQYRSKISPDISSILGVIEDFSIDGDKLSILLKAQERVQVVYYFKNAQEKEIMGNNLKLGLTVNVEGELKTPSNNTIPNTFNYKKYLYNKRIYWIMSASNIILTKQDIAIFYKVKNMVVKKINTYSLTSSYMYAFILGDNGLLDNDIYQTFQKNGVTHLFAISGMHIGFLVMAISYFFKKIKFKEKYISIITIIFLLFYMFLVGLSASVVRASLLYIFLFLNKKFNLKLNNIIILYILFLFLILINPFYVYDLGFTYSFLTSFGLMIFSKKINGNYLKTTLLVSLIAFLFSLPVTLYNFYEFNLLTILNNILIVPLVSIVLFPFTLLTFVIPFLEPLLKVGFQLLEYINIFCSSLSINIIMPKINIFFIIIYYLIIYLIYKFNFKYVALIIILIITFKFIPKLDCNAYIYYLDVGQGDSTLIITEHQKEVIMVDTGGKIEYDKEPWQIRNKNFNLMDNIVTFLKSKGITKLDLLIITHGDMDHLGYAQDLTKNIKVKSLMLNNNKNNISEEKLLKLISKKVKDNYVTESISIRNLNSLNENDENNSSLVLYISLFKKNLLIMGDAPKKVEADIINKYKLETDVLKLGHHGSNTSSDIEFLKNINPKYAIISAGRNNRYNHPSSETIKNLKATNINYFSTQDKGTIIFKVNGVKETIIFYPP